MKKHRSIVRYENTVRGRFIRRINRFTAEVLIDGQSETVHVKNTGRLESLLVPDARVTLQRVDSPGRKTAYDLISVYKKGLKWVNVDSLVPNELMKQELMNLPFSVLKPEYSYGKSRFDFYMENAQGKFFTEVKGCTLTRDPESGIGYFPDAPTERGIKHIDELIKASEEGYHCRIAFVIPMNGIHLVYPNDEIQPGFGAALRRAARMGVTVACYSCRVEPDSIEITGVTNDTERYLN